VIVRSLRKEEEYALSNWLDDIVFSLKGVTVEEEGDAEYLYFLYVLIE
jgi:hypothetical protein